MKHNMLNDRDRCENMGKAGNYKNEIRKETTKVLTRVVIFLCYYIALILVGIVLFAGAAILTYLILDFMSFQTSLSIRMVLACMVILVAMWVFCYQIGGYLIKPLSTLSSNEDESRRVEITEKDCPLLFMMIKDVADATGNRMPKHVYLSPDVNAYVFYDSVSIRSVFFPTQKNLNIGIGLLHGMNCSELKAILSHEFGHFSQESMRVGVVTYRLLLIIRTMVEHAEKHNQEYLAAKTQDDYLWYLHLAAPVISFIARRTIAIYKWIELENRRLSRYMEFEADTVACNIAGAKAVISSLCKAEHIDSSHSLYSNIIRKLFQEKYRITDFWSCYKYVYEYFMADEGLYIDSRNVLYAPVGDEAKCQSRITITNGWDTHPSLQERISNASQYLKETEDMNLDDGETLVDKEILNEVGTAYMHEIAANEEQPIVWIGLIPMETDAFTKWFDTMIPKLRQPSFIFPFTQKRIVNLDMQSLAIHDTEGVDTPFTEKNRNFILEYNQAYKDRQTLQRIQSGELDITEFTYNGKTYTNATSLTAIHEEYMQKMNQQACELDMHIYRYLYANTENKVHFATIYEGMIDLAKQSDNLNELYNQAYEMEQELNFYASKGKNVSIDEDIRQDFNLRLWKTMRQLDYEKISKYIHELKEAESVSEITPLLLQWRKMAEKEEPFVLSDDNMLRLTGDIWNTSRFLFTTFDNEWQETIVDIYRREATTIQKGTRENHLQNQ